jgi:hypothetical protein
MNSARTTARQRSASIALVSAMAAGWLVLSLVLAPLASASSPEAGERGRYRGQCKRLTRQLEHYEETVLPMAIDRRNRGWEAATNDQIERLWHRRADLCPEYGAQRSLMRRAADRARKFNKLLAAAGRAAASYFTGGMAGGF